MHVKHLFFLYTSMRLIIHLIIHLLYALFFSHSGLQLPRQRLLGTFKSQQRYLEVSAGPSDDFETVFETIWNILEPIFDISSRQGQNFSVNHEIARSLYTPPNTVIRQPLSEEKIYFYTPKRFEKLFNLSN